MPLLPRQVCCSLFLQVAVVLLVFVSNAELVSAQGKKNDKGPAFTEPPKNDWNYELMGEFVGPIAIGENKYESLGVQIRPLGHDNFQAVAFMGGLPGQEKHKPKMTKMTGRRSGEFLILSGGPWAIIVEKDHCKLISRDGKNLGRLERLVRTSPTLGAEAPKGAIAMFDGTSVDQFSNAQMTKEGLLMEGADFKPMFQDFNLHAEFRLPFMPQADGQSRSNSGLYLQSRYECQVLDSFGTEPMIDGCGALYRFKKPNLNMCFAPLVWQTYDVHFTAPRWSSDGSKFRNARITSWINGVKVQDDVELPNKTGAGKTEEPVLLPIKLQNHGDPVRFRNIWIIDRGLTQIDTFPVMAPKDGAKAKPKKKTEKKELAEPKKEAVKPSEKKADETKAGEKKAKEKKPAEAKKRNSKQAKEEKPKAK